MHTARPSAPGPIFCFALAFGLLLQACGGQSDSPAPSSIDASAEPPSVEARVETAQARTVADTFWATGSVLPVARVSPGTKLLGRIDRFLVSEGQQVRRGQELARLESRDLRAAVAQAEAAVDMAEAQLVNARAQHARMVELHGRGSVTDKNLEDAVAGFRTAEAALAQAEANVEAARVDLGYAVVRSPIDGWVVKKHAEAGDMTRPGAPLVTLEDLSRVKVEVDVGEARVGSLGPSTELRVEILGRTWPARFDQVVPAGDPASRTFRVRLLVDNPDGTLRSGMFARVALGPSQAGNGVESAPGSVGGAEGGPLVESVVESVVELPTTAIVERGQLRGVFVVDDDGRARLRWLRLGATRTAEAAALENGTLENGTLENGTLVTVLSGLDPGESYVLDPPPGLQDGTRIEGR